MFLNNLVRFSSFRSCTVSAQCFDFFHGFQRDLRHFLDVMLQRCGQTCVPEQSFRSHRIFLNGVDQRSNSSTKRIPAVPLHASRCKYPSNLPFRKIVKIQGLPKRTSEDWTIDGIAIGCTESSHKRAERVNDWYAVQRIDRSAVD
jgi:hypothetical protein